MEDVEQRRNRVLTLEGRTALHSADRLELMSIDPFHLHERKGSQWVEGCTIVKRIQVTPEVKDDLIAALYEIVDPFCGISALCYEPHHAIRAHVGKDYYDFVICFMCANMRVLKNSNRISMSSVNGSAARLNEMLAVT
jgi:hypothetical protein